MPAKISQKSETQVIFDEYDGAVRKLGEVKTKTFDSECIIQVFLRNSIFFARRALTNMKRTHTGLL